jgi:gentisate 1,2-dioxygenase
VIHSSIAEETPMSQATQTPELVAFSQEIKDQGLSPLWERTVSQKPGTPCVPHLWSWSDLEPKLHQASRLIGAKDAERRVLMLENPAMPGSSFINQTLFTGLQIILPGEIASAHRHTPNALRFVVKGEGAYTSVGGERTMMRPGDFIVTPNWSWHDHGNIGSEPVVWMDGLDSAFTKFFGTTFREEYPLDTQPVHRTEGDAAAAFGSAMLPVDFDGAGKSISPILVYPYERTRAALKQSQPAHPAHGVKLRYANPANGRYPFPTIAAFMQLLPKGFAGKTIRTTENTTFNVAEGEGHVQVGDKRLDFGPHDIFVVPAWTDYALHATTECTIFSYSDRAAQEALGFFREEIL